MRSALLAVVTVACGGTAAKPLSNTPGATGDGPEVQALRALAGALEKDDAGLLVALVDPSEGAMFWYQHAQMIPPAQRIGRDLADRPSAALEIITTDYKGSYTRDVAAAIEVGLRRVKHTTYDEPDRCEDRGRPRVGRLEMDGRAVYLALEHLGGNIVDHHVSFVRSTARFRTWGLEVYLKAERGRVWITHVVVWDPCDVRPRLEMPEKMP